ncbi:MAG: MFS transporter [Propionicimonas sp.]
MLPIAVAALIVGALRLRDVSELRPGSLDVLSVILSALGFGGVLYGLSAIGEAADAEPLVAPWIPILVGGVALGVFVWRQLALARGRSPLLDVRAFGSGQFALAIVIVAISAISFFGSIIVLPIYYQSDLGLTTLQTGLLLLPGGVAMGVASAVSGRIYDRVGPRVVVPVAAGLVSVGMWGMAVAVAGAAAVWIVVAAHVVLSLGVAALFTTMFSVALGSIRSELYSHGSAIVSTVQQLSAGVGTALFITLLSTSAATAADPLAAGVLAALVGGGFITLVAVTISFLIRAPKQPRPAGAAPAH